MIITKKAIPRRAVLRGIGATLALPWLDSMVPALTAVSRSAASPARRFGVFYVPNGMSMGYWWPQAEGALAELPPTLKSLDSLKDRLLLVGGLGLDAANKVKGAGAHSRSSGTFLTCVPFQTITDANVIAGTTVDQLAAGELAKDTQITSLELGLESADILGACDGASCALTNTISWRTPTTPLPIENDPRAVFERLFGVSDSTDPAVRQAGLRRSRSMLDAVADQVARLKTRLGPGDTLKFTEYLDSLRDVERRIQKAEEQSGRELPVIEQPMGVPGNYAEHAKLMMDLLALSYQADLTRVSTFMLAREVSSRAYPEIGVADSHHPLSHHSNEPAKLERLHRVNELHFQQFAHFAQRLAALPEGEGTMLDHTLLLYGAGISDSNTHFYDDLPIAVVGGTASGINSGRYVRFPKGTPLANLHLTLLDRMGVRIEKLGDSTGRLPDIGDATLGAL
jgi:hypothetical protein